MENKQNYISNILSQLRDTISACGCLHFSPKHHTAAEVQECDVVFDVLANTDTGSQLSFYSQKRTIAVLTGIIRPAIVHDKDRCGCACVTRALSTGLREDLLRSLRGGCGCACPPAEYCCQPIHQRLHACVVSTSASSMG